MRWIRLLAALLLAVGASGCAHQYTSVVYNGWPIQYHDVTTLRIPRGLEADVQLVEPKRIEIEGDLAAEINGRQVKVIEGVLWYNERKYEIAEGDIIRIEKDGSFRSITKEGFGSETETEETTTEETEDSSG